MIVNPAQIITDTILGAFGYNLELVGITLLVLVVLFLTTIAGSRGMLLVGLLAFTVLFAVIVPTLGWVMWVLILVSIGLVLVGLRIWFSKIF
jgi:hypothetical protein